MVQFKNYRKSSSVIYYITIAETIDANSRKDDGSLFTSFCKRKFYPLKTKRNMKNRKTAHIFAYYNLIKNVDF